MSYYGESYARTLLWIFLVPISAAALTALTQISLVSPSLVSNLKKQLNNYTLAYVIRQLNQAKIQHLNWTVGLP